MPNGRTQPSDGTNVSLPTPSNTAATPRRHDLSHRLHEIDLAIEHGVIAAVRLRDLRLRVRADRADDGGAEMLRPLAQDQPDAARRRVDEDHIARLRPKDPVDDQRRGEALDHHGGGVRSDMPSGSLISRSAGTLRASA